MKKVLIKKIIILTSLLALLQSCTMIEKYICSNYKSDEYFFRSKASAISSDKNMAEEKALFIAKQNITKEIDDYILNKYSYKEFLKDPDFEKKLNTAEQHILENISVPCKKTILKRDRFKSFVAIEIEKKSIEKSLEKQLKN